MSIVLITGANRGIGLSLTKQLLESGETVFGGCRRPEAAADLQKLQQQYPQRLHIITIEVTDDASIVAALQDVAASAGQLDLLINNAGLLERHETPDTLDSAVMMNSFHVNTVGPMMVARHALDLLRRSRGAKIINISSQLGSLSRKSSGGLYSYCSSKAALNMMTRALAFDLKGRNICVVCVHPGWVQTDMGGPNAAISPETSAAGLIKLAQRISISDSGKFFTWEGQEHQW